jgi:iron complex transport system ATP-binding protein
MSEGILTVKNGTFGYENKIVLSKVNFSVTKGTLVGLVGPNGIGKSTLLETLRGLLPLMAGEITLEGKNIAELSEKAFAKKAAYLRQHNQLPFAYTVKEVVAAGRYPYLDWWQQKDKNGDELVNECMDCLQVRKLQNRPVNQLSGGQRQRVLLAKVLAQQTAILFLDEPTADLDFVFTEELFRFAQLLSQAGKTVIMAVHELNLAYKYCSEILLLEQGGLLATGRPEKVMTEENLSASYGVPVSVQSNIVTGGIDVSAPGQISEEIQKGLLLKICK